MAKDASSESYQNPDEKGQVFNVLINNKLKAWRDAYDDDNRYLVTENVTMVKRDRSDYFGNFDEEWLDKRHPLQMTWKPQMSKGMVTYPVIRRSVNAKIATELATGIKLAIEPVRKDPQTESVAQKSESISAYFRRLVWDTSFDYAQSKMRQLGRLAYVYTSSNLEGGLEIPFPIMTEKPVMSGTFHLGCQTCGAQVTPEEVGMTDPLADAQGRLDTAFEENRRAIAGMSMAKSNVEPDYTGVYDEAAQIPDINDELYCPMCAEQGQQGMLTPQANGVSWQMAPFHDGTYEKKPTGTISSRLVSHLNTRVDEFNAIGFRLNNAHWFNFRFLMPTYQLEQMCGDDDTKKRKVKDRGSREWSDAVRWSYELMKKRGNVIPDVSESRVTHLTEVEIWWIQPVACDGWKCDSEFQVGKWKIRPGQSICDSFGGKDKFVGLGVMVCGEELLKVFNEDFRKKWTGIAWTPDPYAYFPQGEERLLHLQDAATRVFTLIYSFSQRSAAPRTVAHRKYFTRDDLEAHVVGGIILSKAGTDDKATGFDLKRYIFNLEAGELPQMMQAFVEMIVTIVKEESGVYDEVTGAGDQHNKTKGGREVALNRSLGLQLPQMQAKGQGLVNWTYQILEHAQEMEDHFFLLFTDEDEEEWTNDDIENFRNTDIRKELNVSVVEGSDVPRTREELEEAYLIAIQEGLFDPANPTPVDIRSIILKIRGIDYDLDDFDANQRVANIRYDNIKRVLLDADPSSAIIMTPVIDPATGMPSVQIDPQTQQPGEPLLQPSLHPKIINDLMTNPLTQVQEFADNHFVFIQFFKRKLFGVIGSRQINPVLMLGLNLYITAHRGYIAAEMARQVALSGGGAGGEDPNTNDANSSKDKGKPPQKGSVQNK
jgi:hypothetical protein